jgi:hypothetical protein
VKQITNCARKHHPLNYKSNVQLGNYRQSEQFYQKPTKDTFKQQYRPSIRVVGNFGFDQEGAMPAAGKSTRLANYFNSNRNGDMIWKPEPSTTNRQIK